MSPDDPRHGSTRGYRHGGCRCQPCRDAAALQENRYLLRRAANHGQPLLMDKTGAVRRLHALMAIGWPRRTLALQAGYTSDAFAGVLHGRRATLTLATHHRIVTLYDRLCMTPGPSSSTRLRAASKGWPSPLAWDDIDTDLAPVHGPRYSPDWDTSVDEVMVQRVIDGHDKGRRLTNAEAREAVRRLRARGVSTTEMENRYGLKPERYPAEAAS